MKNKTIKTKAIEGLVSGKLKLRKVYKRPNLIFNKDFYVSPDRWRMEKAAWDNLYTAQTLLNNETIRDIAIKARCNPSPRPDQIKSLNDYFNQQALIAMAKRFSNYDFSKEFENIESGPVTVTHELKLPGNYDPAEVSKLLSNAIINDDAKVTFEDHQGTVFRLEKDNLSLTIDTEKVTPEQIQEYMNWCKESFDIEDLKQTWLTDVDNTFLLRTNTNYPIDIRAGYVLIDNRKYKFELDTKGLGLDIDGDTIQTSMLNHAMVCRAGYKIDLNYKQIKILGEL